MLVVKVEVWPGGDESRAREIERLYAGNISSLADVSDYIYRFGDRDWMDGNSAHVFGHRRSDGAWELVRRILESERAASEPRQG